MTTPFQRFALLLTQTSLILTGLCLPLSTTATDIFITTAAIAFLFTDEVFSQLRVQLQQPLVIACVIFLLWIALGVFWSSGPWYLQAHDIYKFSKLLMIPLLIPPLINPAVRRQCITAFLIMTILTAVLSIMKWQEWINIGHPQDFGDIFHNHYKEAFILSLGAYILLLRMRDEKKWKFYYLFYFSLITFDIFCLTGGDKLGYLLYIFLLFVFIIQSSSRWLYYGSIFGVISLFIFASFKAQQMISLREETLYDLVVYFKVNDHSRSLGERMKILKTAWLIFTHNLIIGSGTGTFASDYRRLTLDQHHYMEVKTTHNELLLIAAQWGSIGLLLFFILVLMHGKTISKLEEKDLSKGILIILIVGVVSNNFLLTSLTQHLYIYFTALTLATLPPKSEKSDTIPLQLTAA